MMLLRYGPKMTFPIFYNFIGAGSLQHLAAVASSVHDSEEHLAGEDLSRFDDINYITNGLISKRIK